MRERTAHRCKEGHAAQDGVPRKTGILCRRSSAPTSGLGIVGMSARPPTVSSRCRSARPGEESIAAYLFTVCIWIPIETCGLWFMAKTPVLIDISAGEFARTLSAR